MASFVITAVFEVEPGRVPLGKDVIARPWGAGHQFSYCDGRMLTLVVEVTAPDVNHAFETVLSRAEAAWEGLTGRSLPAPSTLRLQTLVPQEMVVAGAVGRGPDRLFAEAAAARAAHLRAAVTALTDLHRRGRRGPRPDLSPWNDFDDPPDDGGLAGVREPRRPGPGPGGGAVALELPPPFPAADVRPQEDPRSGRRAEY
jgi:hypothetical protein